MAEQSDSGTVASATVGDESAQDAGKKKGGLKPVLIGLVAALVLGGATAYAVMSGLAPIPGLEDHAADEHSAHGEKEEMAEAAPPAKFVNFEPLSVTFVQDGAPRQLRITLSLETSEAYFETVEQMKPRALDTVNTLLRALDERDLANPAAFDRLRAQMLRRIRIATDPTAIRDLLITEYVIF